MKEGFWNSLASKEQEIGYVVGTGVTGLLILGMINPSLAIQLLATSATLVIGGALVKSQKSM